ncbi:hypothetical protein [Amycolatopsis sp.]|uniref:hypothetical protein n=1 Tax=Amycolatopsis sp. TaxID=37632 RepID=UPI002E020D66|nr:hypothetical protein [Amycolatopsis sp.]
MPVNQHRKAWRQQHRIRANDEEGVAAVTLEATSGQLDAPCERHRVKPNQRSGDAGLEGQGRVGETTPELIDVVFGRDRTTIRSYLSGDTEPGRRKTAGPDPFEPYVAHDSAPADAAANRRLLLTSDGIHQAIPRRSIARAARVFTDAEFCARNLTLAARYFGGRDNPTALVVDPQLAPGTGGPFQ